PVVTSHTWMVRSSAVDTSFLPSGVNSRCRGLAAWPPGSTTRRTRPSGSGTAGAAGGSVPRGGPSPWARAGGTAAGSAPATGRTQVTAGTRVRRMAAPLRRDDATRSPPAGRPLRHLADGEGLGDPGEVVEGVLPVVAHLLDLVLDEGAQVVDVLAVVVAVE